MALSLQPDVVLQTVGAVLSFVSFTRKSMLPLRAFAIGSNVVFLAYGFLDSMWPTVVLHTLLLPLNTKRLMDIRRLTAEIRKATELSPASQWLLPHMTRGTFKAGQVLFHEGDAADSIIYIASGEVRLVGTEQRLGPGELIGEIGLFSPDRKRTQTVICLTDAELYSMTDDMMYRLYYQNPELGFYFIRLIVGRLQQNIARERVANAAGLLSAEPQVAVP